MTLLLAALLLFVPGALLGAALHMRGWLLAGAAPLLSFALLLVALVTTVLAHVRWTVAIVGGIAAAVVVVAAIATALVRGRSSGRPWPVGGSAEAEGEEGVAQHPGTDRLWSALGIIGLSAGAAIGFLTIVQGTGQLREPNQGFDAIFHVNVVELITRTGDASPAATGTLNGYPSGVSVYPDAFHAMASLIVQLHGTSLTSINALLACIPLVAGAGLVALLRSMGRVREAVVVPIVLAATTGYPTDLIWRGPIWVYVFGISFIPAFLLLLRSALARRSLVSALVLGLAAGALAMIHPSAALSAAGFGFFFVAARWASRPKQLLPDVLVLGSGVVIAGVLSLPLIGKALVDSRGGTIVHWPAVMTAGQAIGSLALYNFEFKYPQLWLALPALMGLVVGWRHRPLRWWYGGTALFAFLCVLASAYEGPVVQLLTGPWWDDRYRFEGLTYLGLSVFCAVGLVAVADLLARTVTALTARWSPSPPPRARVAVAVGTLLVAVLAVGWLGQGFYVGPNDQRMSIAYVSKGGGSVDQGDVAAFAALKELAGDGPVLNDPNDGSGWMWSIAGVRPVFGAAVTVPVSPPLPGARQLVVEGLNCFDTHQEVRQAVAQLGVRYVYSSATVIPGAPPEPGFQHLSSVRSLRPVYQHDGATIYEIDPVPMTGAADDPACAMR